MLERTAVESTELFTVAGIVRNGMAYTVAHVVASYSRVHSTVTDFARFRGLSTSVPRTRAT